MEDIKVPIEVLREIARNVSADKGEGARERKAHENAWVEIQRRLLESNIPEEECENIKKDLHNMYGANYVTQRAELQRHIDRYWNIVKTVEENSK